MYNLKFWQATAERAVKTLAQALIALTGANAANVLTSDLGTNLKVGLGAAILSVLFSIVSAQVGKTGPSLAGETTEPRIITVEVPVKAPAAAVKKPAAKKTTPKPAA